MFVEVVIVSGDVDDFCGGLGVVFDVVGVNEFIENCEGYSDVYNSYIEYILDVCGVENGIGIQLFVQFIVIECFDLNEEQDFGYGQMCVVVGDKYQVVEE